jgi:predicted nuclease of predicted toxin-antitoxin system
MQLLLDNCVPWRLARPIVAQSAAAHAVTHVRDVSWTNLLDSPLLQLLENRFDAFVTVDRRMRYQQNIAGKTFFVVVLRARTNRLTDLTPLVPALLAQLDVAEPGHFYEIA